MLLTTVLKRRRAADDVFSGRVRVDGRFVLDCLRHGVAEDQLRERVAVCLIVNWCMTVWAFWWVIGLWMCVLVVITVRCRRDMVLVCHMCLLLG